MIRVLFVLDSLRQGGAEKSLVTLLGALPLDGLSVDVCLAQGGGVYSNQVPARMKVFQPEVAPQRMLRRVAMAAMLRLNRLAGRPIHPAQIAWRFRRSSHAELPGNYDVAVAYSQGFPTYFVASRVQAKRKIAWVNTDYARAGYKAEMDSEYYGRFNSIVCVSDTASEIFKSKHPQVAGKLVVVRSFVSSSEVRSLGGDVNPFAGDDCFQIATVCRLSAPKGLDILIDAAVRLNSGGLHFKWHLVGDGDMRPWVEAQLRETGLSDRVVLHGAQSNPYPYMKFCDVYCQPSRFEGFSRTVAEARAFAKPVVVTEYQSARDQIVHGENGLVVQMNGAAVADAIARLAGSPVLRDHLSEGSKRNSSDTISGVAKVVEMLRDEVQPER